MGAFKNNMKDDEAYLDGIGRFDIEVSGSEQVVWSQNGKELPTNAQILKFEMVENGNRRSLIVKNVTKADLCKYSVAAGGDKKEAQLKTKNPFVKNLSNTQGYLGGIAVFECQVQPGMQVTWYFGSKKITKESFSMLKYETNFVGNNRRLIVKNITSQDYAKFSCEAKGQKTTAELGKKTPWVNKLDNAEGFIGGIACFTVKVEPATQVTWYAGSKPINRQNFSLLKYEEIWSGDYRKLLVKNITPKDFMDFSVEAKGDKCKAKMTQMSPWVEKLENAEGPIGGIAVFEAKVHPAMQVTWYYGNKAITKQNFSILKYEQLWEGDWRKLLVKNITEKDFTEFSCEARGEKAKAKLAKGPGKKALRSAAKSSKSASDSKIAPKSANKTAAAPKAAAPKAAAKPANDAAFAKKMGNMSGKMGKIEVFEVQMKDASQTVCWYKESQKISKDTFSILKYETIEKGNLRKLIIKNINMKDGGNYHCEAADGSKISCKLTVGRSAPSSRPAATFDAVDCKSEKSPFGLTIPRNLPSHKQREYVMNEVYEADLKTNKKWVRSPECWNTWIRNPGQ